MKQIAAHKKLSVLHGLLLIFGLVALLLVLNYVILNYIAGRFGYTAASISFWVIGGLIALWMIRTYILMYTYEISGNVLRICRKYGKRERFIEDIYLNRIVRITTPEEAKRKEKNAKVVRAVHSAVKTEKTAVIYKTSAGTQIAILQLDPLMKEALLKEVKK